jgi:uncharacterized repeat protein (TIGR03806 family)
VAVTTLQFPTDVPQASTLQSQLAFPNLTFNQPLFLTDAGDGTNRLFVLEKPGRIMVFPNDPNVTQATVFLDIQDKVIEDGEQGLLGLAFDPQYSTNGFFYVYYSADGPQRSRITRFQVSANANVADPASEMVLLEIAQPGFSNHKAGWMDFGPDGKLYIAVGDGGSGNDPNNNAQNLNSLLGKILRINPDPSNLIPTDNPFVGTAGARPEIWAYGMRNPFRMSFDRGTGTLWAGDVGQNRVEEVDIIKAGGNYGWRIYEGTLSNLNPDNRPATDFTPPIIEYGRDLGNSITGGYVYRGPTLANFVGVYFYGDFGSGRIWALVSDGTGVISNTEVATVANGPASFGEDEAGELYVVTIGDGRISRFVSSAPPTNGTVPTLLSQTGIFSDLATLTPAAGIIEYDVNSPLWSDAAIKRRFLALPGVSRIVFDPQGNWAFPTGSVTIKQFDLPKVGGGTQRIETRVLVNQMTGWIGYSYRWNAEGTDATLVQDGSDATYTVPDANGAARSIVWDFPSSADCLRCHTGVTGQILGLRTNQINRNFNYALRTDNQLRAFNNIGLFDRDIGDVGQYPALVNPTDTTASISARARSYLEANCSQCHQPNGPTPVTLDFRARIALADTGSIDVAVERPADGRANPVRISAGNRNLSEVWLRVGRRDEFAMPPLATNQVDPVAVDVIGQWIDAGAAP